MPTSDSKQTAKSRPSSARALATRAAAAAAAKREGDKRKAESLLALIDRRKARITEDFYDIGEALRDLLRKDLFRALGFASFEAMLAARHVMSSTQAFKLVRLVENLPRDEAVRLGQEKAYALVAYAAATPEADVPADLARADAKVGAKPLSKSSLRDIETAAAGARATAPKKPLSAAARQRRAADRVVERTARAVLRGAGISRVEVGFADDTVVLRVPRSTLERLAKDLARG